MADNKTVQVAVRVRPLVPSEVAKGCKEVLEVFPSVNQLRIDRTDKAFTFNFMFGTQSNQAEIYDACVSPKIDKIFAGYNVTILAYGQTGSGKTHTMGTSYDASEDVGIIPRAVTDIFDRVRDNFSYDFNVTVSFIEIYKETLYDLLSGRERDQCVECPVENAGNVFQALIKGSRSRSTAATNMNAQSSRSHAIFTVNVTMINKKDQSQRSAKFHLVDLAGSERPKKTGAVGNTFKEGVNINKGLLALGNVISALGDDKPHSYISYRDSNLTRLLKDSLGGNSITLMIACVSPSDYNVEETISTLRYADRARKIQNKPIINEDPKAAEINMLKKTIQELKLQIVGQGGPVVCSEKVLLDLNEENRLSQLKIRDLTIQLSTMLHDNTGLMEKFVLLQNANESLHKQICDLKSEYDLVLEGLEAQVQDRNNEGLAVTRSKLKQIQERLTVIDTEQKQTQKDIIDHEQIIDLHTTDTSQEYLSCEESISKDREKYTNKQMALNIELQEINKKLVMKEHLARQLASNTQHLIDYKALDENRARINLLEKEKEELLQHNTTVHHDGIVNKISEGRKKKIQELEYQIQELNKKVKEQAHLIKLKEKDINKINNLNSEILQMKQTRVKLIRKMREESEKFRVWKIQREKEVAKLKVEDRKKQTKIMKMETMHSKQQNVLKRKVEEAVALNKRLKDALSLRKASQEMKNSGKNEKNANLIKQELDVFLHLIEAKTMLDGLLEDRATLQEQLDKMKENKNNDSFDSVQLRTVEEDIELRSVQIHDLQQKILDSDEENRTSKLDNLQTMAEAKLAVRTMLEQIEQIKKEEVSTRAKLMESKTYQNENNEKCEQLNKKLKGVECNYAKEVAELQAHYEEKIAVLLRQLRGIELRGASEDLQETSNIQLEQIKKLEQRNEELSVKNQELEARLKETTQKATSLNNKLDVITMASMPNNISPASVPDNVSPDIITPTPIKKVFLRHDDNDENCDISYEGDDPQKDPDWRKTPIGKWLLHQKNKIQKGVLTENTSVRDGLVKRTSGGGCTCTKSNCKGRCGCNKIGRRCSSACKCSSSSCVNRGSADEDTTEEKLDDTVVDKRRRIPKQNLFATQDTDETF